MELGPQNHNRDGLLGPNSIMVVYMDPLAFVRVPVPQSKPVDLNHIPTRRFSA